MNGQCGTHPCDVFVLFQNKCKCKGCSCSNGEVTVGHDCDREKCGEGGGAVTTTPKGETGGGGKSVPFD